MDDGGLRCLERWGAPWYHVYLDNFCAMEKGPQGFNAGAGEAMHQVLEDSWQRAGVLSSAKKKVVAAPDGAGAWRRATRRRRNYGAQWTTGAEVNSEHSGGTVYETLEAQMDPGHCWTMGSLHVVSSAYYGLSGCDLAVHWGENDVELSKKQKSEENCLGAAVLRCSSTATWRRTWAQWRLQAMPPPQEVQLEEVRNSPWLGLSLLVQTVQTW